MKWPSSPGPLSGTLGLAIRQMTFCFGTILAHPLHTAAGGTASCSYLTWIEFTTSISLTDRAYDLLGQLLVVEAGNGAGNEQRIVIRLHLQLAKLVEWAAPQGKLRPAVPLHVPL